MTLNSSWPQEEESAFLLGLEFVDDVMIGWSLFHNFDEFTTSLASWKSKKKTCVSFIINQRAYGRLEVQKISSTPSLTYKHVPR